MSTPVNSNPAPTTGTLPCSRRWIPLSLRFTLVVLGIGSAMTAVRHYRQYVALREIERIGAAVGIERPPWRWVMLLIGGARARVFASGFTVLCGPNFTDADLIYFKDIPTLYHISLEDTKTTDAGLKHLLGLTSLQELDLYDTRVTDGGVAELKRALPGVTIRRRPTVIRLRHRALMDLLDSKTHLSRGRL